MSAALVLSLIAAVLTAVCAGPQFWRALRTVQGLSLSAWLQAFALGVVWAGYGAAMGAWVLLVSEGPFAVGSLAIVFRLLPAWRTLACAVGCALLVSCAFATLGPGPCLVLASFASVAVRLAQIATALRTGTAAGVSVLTWLLLASSDFAWTAVGILRSDAFFACAAAGGGVASLGVIATCLALSGRWRANIGFPAAATGRAVMHRSPSRGSRTRYGDLGRAWRPAPAPRKAMAGGHMGNR